MTAKKKPFVIVTLAHSPRGVVLAYSLDGKCYARAHTVEDAAAELRRLAERAAVLPKSGAAEPHPDVRAVMEKFASREGE